MIILIQNHYVFYDFISPFDKYFVDNIPIFWAIVEQNRKKALLKEYPQHIISLLEFVILCPEWSTKDVRTALDVLYLGVCQPDNQDQAGRVSRCLKDLNFVGVLGRSDSTAKERRTAVKEERNVDVTLNSSSSDKRPAKNNRNVSDLNMATRLRQFPELRRAAEGSGLECGVCSVPVDWRERNKISLHMRSAKHLR